MIFFRRKACGGLEDWREFCNFAAELKISRDIWERNCWILVDMMDEYTASYYIISSHTQKHIEGSSRIWFQRLKVITLPRELVVTENSPDGRA